MIRSSSKDMKRLNHLIGETDAVYHEMAVRFGLSDSAVRILYTICDYDDGTYCPLQVICRRTGISKQTINSAIRVAQFKLKCCCYSKPVYCREKVHPDFQNLQTDQGSLSADSEYLPA